LMARTVTLIRMLAHPASTPDEILNSVNYELCINNAECLFVTLFCGILNLETGYFHYASAGHDAPLLVRGQRVQSLDLETGPPVGLDEEAVFPPYECSLQASDLIVLYTDGITEAMNPEGDFFSEARLMACLTENQPRNPVQAIDAIRRLHQEFVMDAPQSDDLTLLALQYQSSCPSSDAGKTNAWTIRIPSSLTELEGVKQRLAEYLAGQSLTQEVIEDAQLIVEEMLVNTIQYGYAGDDSRDINLQVTLTPEHLKLTFVDQATPFNPLTEIATPDTDSLDDTERSSGGFGFHLVRALSDHIDYTYQDGKNILVVSQPLARVN
jgi:phosphoserine phosphatase RsbU/P